MAVRVQSLSFGMSDHKQSDIKTIASSHLRFTKIDTEVHTLQYGTETDAAWIGKVNEFTSDSGVYPTSYDISGSVEKDGSVEFMIYAWAYALGVAAFAGGTYTITPLNPATTLELPYFSVVQQLPEGGAMAIDEAYLGCSMDSVETSFTYGPGLSSVTTRANWHGSGWAQIPSGVTLPASPVIEHYAVSPSMAITINGVNYVTAGTALAGSIGWNNNLLLNAGYYPGAGLVNNAAVRGRIEIGPRVPTLSFTARLLNTSTEYAKLIAQTTGTADITFTFDSTHSVNFHFPLVSYQALSRPVENGLVAVAVNIAPRWHSTNGILTVTGKCDLLNIAQ